MDGSWRRSLRATVVASCTALVLAGCANDDEGDDAAQATPDITQTPTPSDAEQITAVAVELATTDDPVRKCEQLATSGFVLAVFGSQENCKTSGDDADSDSEATGADVGSVVVTGDTATAVITLRGGDADGATGSWRFSKDPTGWRLAEWSIDYLRSVLATGFGPDYEADGADDPFADAETRSCFTAKLQSLDDQSFRTVVYSLVANRDDSNEVLGRALIECGYTDPDAPDSEVRAAFEASYRAGASQTRPEADIDCELEQLRESVSDDEIEAAEGGDQDAYAEIEAAAAEAQSECLQTQT